MIILKSKADGVSQAALARFLARAQRATGVTGQVNVLITTGAEMRELNRQFRQQDKPTDVLSFPAAGPAFGAGDIAISVDIAAANARALSHPLSEELKVLMLHGLLHLAGHDHERDSGEMENEERELRLQMKLPVTLIERSRTVAPPRPARNRKSVNR